MKIPGSQKKSNPHWQINSRNRVHFSWTVLVALITLFLAVKVADAGEIYIPNFSFESQPTEFADTRIDSWQKSSPPPGSDTNAAAQWDQLTGIFFNAPPTNADFINNAQGGQLAFLFADPTVAIFQDFNSIDWSNGVPTHGFNAFYTPGKSYTLTVGLTTSREEPLTQGSTLQLSLYYRDTSSNMVTIAATTVTYDTNVFTNITHLTDFHVNVPLVKTNDAWANQHIGIQIMATTAPQLAGGVWDIDNVRLNEFIGVPNFSFESQPTMFVDTRIDSWQKPIPPELGTNAADADQLAGVFINAQGMPDFIDNGEGNQLVYLFADPYVSLFQDANSTDWSNAAPTHAFNDVFTVGKSYDLTVGITSSQEEPLMQGSTLQLSLYYRDSSSNIVNVAGIVVTYDTNIFTNLTHLIDFKVKVPTVKATNAWAGKNIGIQILTTTDPSLVGGVWDLDNVRLTETGIPNYSFESPATEFVDTRIDSWQKLPPPPGSDTNAAAQWDQLTGVFINAQGTPDFIDNAEGSQLAYIFADPTVGFFQDVSSTDWSNGIPTHAFNRKFIPGKAYALMVGFTSSQEEPLTNGSTIQLSLYYRDASNNMVNVAATTVVYTTNQFNHLTHLLDFAAMVPEVKPTDPWAGKNIGMKIETTTPPQLVGGVWDVDNVRLFEFVPTRATAPLVSAGHFGFAVKSEPGAVVDILGANSLTTSFTNITTITNVLGATSFIDTNANVNQHFYRLAPQGASAGLVGEPGLPPLPTGHKAGR